MAGPSLRPLAAAVLLAAPAAVLCFYPTAPSSGPAFRGTSDRAPLSPSMPGGWNHAPVSFAGRSGPGAEFLSRTKVLDQRPLALGGDRQGVEKLVPSRSGHRLYRTVESWDARHPGSAPSGFRLRVYAADRVIIRTAPDFDAGELARILHKEGLHLRRQIAEGVFSLQTPEADLDAVPRALATLARLGAVVTKAEPDGVGFGGGAPPDDPYFPQQWNLANTGQLGGVPGADVRALGFWDVWQRAAGVTVAVLDTGLDFTQPDLQGLDWAGYDFVNGDTNPSDDNGHGTAVTGVILANTGNGIGVAGLTTGVRLLVVKILNAGNEGLTSDLIAGLAYARTNGAAVMNLSLVGYPAPKEFPAEDTLLAEQLALCQSAGIVLSISAGNNGTDNDITPNYPSSYTNANIISVGGHDRYDVRWSGTNNPSNYGATSVDLFAPGRSVPTTARGGSYASYTGTSIATPHVTGTAAVLKALNPSWGATEIKEAILGSVKTKAAYTGLCLSGGRLDALDALGRAANQQPNRDSDTDGSGNLLEYLAGTRADSAAVRPQVSTTVEPSTLAVSMSRNERPYGTLRITASQTLEFWSTNGVSTELSTPTLLHGAVDRTGLEQSFIRIEAVPTGTN
ncbi:MAG: S8 family serine peptidase [Chthoniobacterales bacterium]